MAEAKPLTERQREVLAHLQRGEKVKEIAAALGVTENTVYQTRRRLLEAGHVIPATNSRRKSGRKAVRRQRKLGPAISAASAASVTDDLNLIDPVAVLTNRVDAVSALIAEHTATIKESEAALNSLTDEAKRLTKALRALTPDASRTNGTRGKRRSKQAEAAPEPAVA